MADGPSIDQLNFARGIGQGAAAGGGDEDSAKLLGYLTGVKSSKGIGYYDTQGLQDKPIKPGGTGGASFLFGRMIEAMKKYITREGTPVHSNERGNEVASAGPIEGAPVEAASQGVDFAAILGNSAGNFGSYAYSDMANGTNVVSNISGRGGSIELG